MVDALLNLGHIMRDMESSGKKGKKGMAQLEEAAIDTLESVSGLFDNLYILQSMGIMSEKNSLIRLLNKGNLSNKLWFASLVLTLRRNIMKWWKLTRARTLLFNEYVNLSRDTKRNALNKVIGDKFHAKLKEIDAEVRELIVDSLVSAAYLTIVSIELFKVKLSPRMQRLVNMLSSFANMLRIASVFI